MKRVVSILKRTQKIFSDHDMNVYAGYSTLCILMALIPLLILIVSLIALLIVGVLHERGKSIREWVNAQHIVVRWGLYLMVIATVLVLGTYGYGFNAQDFIYGAF